MPTLVSRRWILSLYGTVAGWLLLASTVQADPNYYEPGVDPGVGFNLISWWNYGATGPTVWENAVQSVYDAGFDEVSISPVRFVTLGSGSIATTSSQGPELSHIAAGITRAKSLGMRVTVNPFVEPAGFSMWRGFYDPTPSSGEWTTFWNDYEQYITDVAVVAEANGADSMTVGTELKAITQNSGNNAKWSSVISAADSNFSGSLGYAANWDNYQNANLTNTIWENSAIDFAGIDSYFTGLLSNGQADASGTYPNSTFIDQVETAWNDKLDNEILPFTASRKSGAGMPVEFTEIGYLPHNRTAVNPQGQSQPVDRDEQNMAYEGLMRALDGRGDVFLAAHIWNWGMPGTGGNLWDMGISGSEPHADNVQSSQWLSSFVSTPVPPDPNEPPPPAGGTEVLYSFENSVEGFYYPNFESEPPSILASVNGVGETDGDHSLAITKPTSTWTWDARVQLSGDQLQALQDAVTQGAEDFLLKMDVSYVASDLPGGLSNLGMHVSFDTSPGGWEQLNGPFAEINGPTNQTFRVEIPLDSFPNMTGSLSTAALNLGFAGSFSGDATFYIDRIALTDTTFVPENADFDGNGRVDGLDFLALQAGLGIASGATLSQGDANGDGAVDHADLAIWESQYGNVSGIAAVPEPTSVLILIAGCALIPFRMNGRS